MAVAGRRSRGAIRDRRSIAAEPEPLILFVGRLVPLKGPQVLIEAMGQVAQVHPEAQLVLVGDGALRDQLRQHAQELGLAGQVRLLGYVRGKPLAALYRAADVVVVPSLYEPFGLVALEAMVSGTPVVAADAGGLAALVRDQQTGLKVPPNDPRALAGGILRLLTDHDLASGLAANARRMAMKQYSWTDVAKRTLALYQGLQG